MVGSLAKQLLLFAAAFLFTATAQAAAKNKIVSYDYAGTMMKGYLAWDDAVKGPRPAVMVVHDFWGLNDYARRRVEGAFRKFMPINFGSDMA